MTTISNMLLRTCYCVCYTTVSKNKMPLWRILTILMAVFLKLEKNIDRKFFPLARCTHQDVHLQFFVTSTNFSAEYLTFWVNFVLMGSRRLLVRSWKISLILCHFKFVGKTKQVFLPKGFCIENEGTVNNKIVTFSRLTFSLIAFVKNFVA